MDRLGDDALVNIFNKIADDHIYNYSRIQNDRRSFYQVSKRFLKVACTGLRRLDILVPDLLLDIIPYASPNLLWFHCSKPLSNAHMKLFLSYPQPNLLHLYISLEQGVEPGEFDFDDNGLCAAAKGCMNLVNVELCGRLNVGDAGVISLVKSCKSLEYLNLEGCGNVTYESLKAIGESSSIHRLVLDGCSITDLGLEYLVNGDLKNHLLELDLSGCDRISDHGIIYLKQMVGLFRLYLIKCGVNVTDYGIVALVSQLPNLDILDLSWLINVTDISLSAIASKCLELSKLYLTGCEAITAKGLHAFFGHQTLNELVLFSCHNFSWEDLEPVASTCTALEYLGLSKRIKTPTPEGSTGYLRFGHKYCWIDWDEDSGTQFLEKRLELQFMEPWLGYD